LGYSITLSDKAKDFIAEKGFDKEFGARPLNRAIQKYIEDALAEEIISNKLQEGDTILMDHKDEDIELTIKVKKVQKKTEPKE